MGIGLVADIPDQLVARRVEHIVQRHRQLDHAEPRAEMAASAGDHGDEIPAQLVGQLGKLARFQPAEIGGGVHLVEERGVAHAASYSLRATT